MDLQKEATEWVRKEILEARIITDVRELGLEYFMIAAYCAGFHRGAAQATKIEHKEPAHDYVYDSKL